MSELEQGSPEDTGQQKNEYETENSGQTAQQGSPLEAEQAQSDNRNAAQSPSDRNEEFESEKPSDELHGSTSEYPNPADSNITKPGIEELKEPVNGSEEKNESEMPSGVESSDESEFSGKEEVVDELAHVIEALIFASDEPLTLPSLKSVLDSSRTFGRTNTDTISSRIRALNNKYESDGSGFRILEVADGYQFATRKELAQWVSNLFKERSKRKLSNSALETLAIIAYKQPVTKPEIESIRGVNIDYVLHSLLEKEIVTVTGRAETVGRPLLYGTTQRFLKVFALRSLEDLPKLREIDEIIKEIKSKGAEESIQLEITALEDQPSPEKKNGEVSPPETGPSHGEHEAQQE